MWGLALATAALIVGAAPAQAAPRSGPDLAVRGVSAPAGKLAAGQRGVRLKITVRNAGDRRARASALRLLLSKDRTLGRGDRRIAQKTLKPLAPGKTVAIAATVTLPATLKPGSWRLLACADAAGKLRERSERNNCRAGRCAGAPCSAHPDRRRRRRPGGPTPATVPTRARSRAPTAHSPRRPPTPTPAATTTPTATPDAAPARRSARPAGEDPRRRSTRNGGDTRSPTPTRSSSRGANPLQTGVARRHHLRPPRWRSCAGAVRDPVGSSIGGRPRSRVLDHPELRSARATRADGRYDLAVNGGGPLTLVFEPRRATSRAQRNVDVPWQRLRRGRPDFLLVPYDPAGTQIDLGADGRARSRAEPVTDDYGTRQATLAVRAGHRRRR